MPAFAVALTAALSWGCGDEFTSASDGGAGGATTSSSGDGGAGATAGSGGSGGGSGGMGGCVNQALLLDGLDDFVQVPANDDLEGNSALTIEAWIRPTEPMNGEMHILSHHNNPLHTGYVLMVKNRRLELRYQGNNINYVVIGTGDIAPDVWTHVAGVFNGTSLKVFVDGTMEQQNNSVPITLNSVCACPLRIGHAAVGNFPFLGHIDEVHLSKAARYIEDFTRPSQRSQADANSIALWHFEDSGQTIADDTGSHDGTLGPTTADEGQDPTLVAAPCVGER